VYSTEISRLLNAPRAVVYRALIDPDAITKWRVPVGMSAVVHEFEPWVGGRIRMSLTYDGEAAGKSGPHTDTYAGYFQQLVPDALVVEVIEFETSDASLQGVMTMTTSLTDVVGGTEVLVLHEGVPDAIPPEDNEAGMRMALDHLARLIESVEH
jgi:uncharacterized protein YndB with AHSA1/START domain